MDSLLRVAVISDTHNHVPQNLPSLISEADEIWHLGDVCSPEVLKGIEALDIKLSIVKGNMDPYGIWPETLILERHGLEFKLQHLPPRSIESDYDATLFGHLHYPSQDTRGGSRVLNPGAVTGPRRGSHSSFAWLSILKDSSWTWDVQPIN